MIIYKDEKGADLRQPNLKQIKDLILEDREDEAKRIINHFVKNFTVESGSEATVEYVLDETIHTMKERISLQKKILKIVFKGIDEGRQSESIIKMAKMIISCCEQRKRKLQKKKNN